MLQEVVEMFGSEGTGFLFIIILVGLVVSGLAKLIGFTRGWPSPKVKRIARWIDLIVYPSVYAYVGYFLYKMFSDR